MISYAKIDWEHTDYSTVQIMTPMGADEDKDNDIETEISDFGNFDIVIGSDLLQFVCVPGILVPFLDTIFKAHGGKLVFYMCYVERSKLIHDKLIE